MELKVYNKLCFYENSEEFQNECFHRLTSYHWENDPQYRPCTYFKMGVVGENLVATLKCYEENPKAVYTERDEPIYKDSCLEFFVAPLEDREEYINIEMNSKGVFLCEFGKGKYDRALVSGLAESSPLVESFQGEDLNGAYWGVTATLSPDFLSELYKIKKSEINFTTVKANFYKCGDDCAIPHYLAYSPVTTLPPGFHNPRCFAVFKK